MIPSGPAEVVNRLIHAIPVLVWTIGVVTKCGTRAPGSYYKAQDGDLRSSPGERRHLRYPGKVQLRHDVTGIGKDSRLQVVEIVEAESEFIDLRGREHPRIR